MLSADENGDSDGEMAAGYVFADLGGESNVPDPIPPVDEGQSPKQNTGLIIGLVCAAVAAAGGGTAAVLAVRKKRGKAQ